MSKVVRASKYRHVFGQALKPELCYDGLKPSGSAWDTNYVHSNRTYFAVCWQAEGGGSFAVVPHDATGKLASGYPLVAGHKSAVLDVQFNPFNESIVASASEDGTAKIWKIPEGGLKDTMREPVQNLIGHKRKVGSVQHHPTASNVLATTSTDYAVKVWDVESGKSLLTIEGHANVIQDLAWNPIGAEMCSGSKDKKLRIIDPRAQKITSEVQAHEGVKGLRCCYLGKTGKIFSVGFSKLSDRQYAVWDPRKLDESLLRENVDTASGLLMPFWDDDTGIVYLCGKGDGNVRYYEVTESGNEVYFLSEFKSAVPAKGMCMVPKLNLKINECEVTRLLKLDTHSVTPISFYVPRKSEMFQDDIFPDTYAYKAAMTASEWLGGKNVAAPTVSLAEGFVPVEKGQDLNVTEVKSEDDGPKDEKELRAEYKRLKDRVAYLESEIAKRDAKGK
jgi:coronin-1B/1C/6